MNVVWKGTRDEGADLLAAVQAHCVCGRSATPCGVHAWVLAGQMAFDRLLFARQLRERWVAQEWRD